MQTTGIDQMIKDMEHGVYNFTENGKCTQCGDCCSNVLPMTQEEVDIIKNYIKRYKIRECKRLFPTRQEAIDLSCPFLDTTKKSEKCRIYEVRPRVCRNFICDPKQRKVPDREFTEKCFPVFLRETFFGKEK